MVRRLIAVLLCGTVLSGCAVHEVHKDHDLIRSTLLDLYTNQIIDNLVRAKNGMPIIQLDYTQASAMVTITNSISGSDAQAVTASNLLTIPAATLAATRTIMTTLMGSLGNMNANQVTIGAVPLITSNEVYDAYLQFLDDAKNPGSLMVTNEAPEPGLAHVCKKCNGKYYWVPVTYQDLFFKLALLTTARRGKPLQDPDPYFKIVAQKIEGAPKDGSKLPNGTVTKKLFILQLDKAIPNDSGYVIFDDDPQTQYNVSVEPDKPDAKLSQSQYVTATVPADAVDDFTKRLGVPRPGRIFLDHKQPTQATVDDMLGKISFQLQQIQFNQLRAPSGL
jgi:hypothetical protein